MQVAVACANCGQPFHVPETNLGRQARCSKCGQQFVLKAVAEDTVGSLAAPVTETSDAVPPVPTGSAKPGGRQLPHAVPLSPAFTADDREPLPTIKPYVCRRMIGEGAMGKVYLAHDPRLDRDVAIKVLPRQIAFDPQRVERFRREARMAAKVQHPNTVVVYEADVRNGQAFLVMELVDGQSLDKLVPRGQPLDWREATRAIRDAAAGLGAAHELGVVHRDVKPANLMRTSKGATKVLDFGLARAVQGGTQLTQQGSFLGTPAYMAPEIWMGREAEPRSDLYSLVCSYYQLLTGRVPFDAGTWHAVGYQHRYEPLPDPRAVVPNLPDAICRILIRGSQKEPAARYQTAGELLTELAGVLASPPQSLPFGSSWAELGGRIGAAPQTSTEPAGDFFASILGAADKPNTDAAASSATVAGRANRLFASVSRRRGYMAIALAGLALCGVLAAAFGGLFRVRTPEGTIALRVNEPDADVTVDGQKITVQWGPDRKSAEITAPPGKHRIEVKKSGFTVAGKELAIEDAGREVFTAVLESAMNPDAQIAKSYAGHGASPATNDFVPLFDGKTLDGWRIDGNATWSASDGAINGDGDGNGVLTSQREFGDFELQADAKINSAGNSGVFFRITPNAATVIKNYEIQVIGSEGRLPGGYPHTGDLFGLAKVPESHVQDDQWFQLHLVANGNHILVRLDDKEVLDYIDAQNRFTRGSIGLQKLGRATRVSFRNIRVKELPATSPPPDALQPGSVWGDSRRRNCKFSILERQGEKFRASFVVDAIERDVRGTIADGKISWKAADVVAIKGRPGGDNDGTIKGDSIDFTWHDDRGGSGKFTLSLQTPAPVAKSPQEPAKAPGDAPPLAAAPFDAAMARAHQQAWASYLGMPVEVTNSIGTKLVLVPPGEFLMGSPESELGTGGKHKADEKQHRVRITKPFYIGVFSVTQAEYERVMGKNPSWFSSTGGGKDKVAGIDTSRFPVDQASWDEAIEFCRKVTESERQAERLPASWKYTLPTEAQWEYACRAGTTTAYNMGDTISTKDANFDNRLQRTTAVGSYEPNAWGLYDMHGNVWQWCVDRWSDGYYDNSPTDDPTGATNGADRLIRGGSWNITPVDCRSANRTRSEPAPRAGHRGFRLTRVPSSE